MQVLPLLTGLGLGVTLKISLPSLPPTTLLNATLAQKLPLNSIAMAYSNYNFSDMPQNIGRTTTELWKFVEECTTDFSNQRVILTRCISITTYTTH